MQNKINFWMVTTLVLVGVLLFIVGTFFQNPFVKKIEIVPTQTISVTPDVSPEITGTVNITPSPTPTVQEESDLLQLQKAFAKKFNRPVSEAEVTISKKDDAHISGGIKFTGDTGGGWFLAYKSADGWIIVQDGNGTISCETVAPYNFPKSMVPECVDANGNLVK